MRPQPPPPGRKPVDVNAKTRKSFLLRTFDRLHGAHSEEYAELSGILSDGITVREVQALAFDLFNRVGTMIEPGGDAPPELGLLDGLRLQVQLLEAMRKMAIPDDPADQNIGPVTIKVAFADDMNRAANRGPGVKRE